MKSSLQLMVITGAATLVLGVIAQTAVSLFSHNPIALLWANRVGLFLSALGFIQLICASATWLIRRKNVLDQRREEALADLQGIAGRRRLALSGGIPSSLDYFPVPWHLSQQSSRNTIPTAIETKDTGTVVELARLLLDSRQRSVAILGPPGAGKTALTELVLEECARGRCGGKAEVEVLVRLHLSGWDPTSQPFVLWAGRQIRRDAGRHGDPLAASQRLLVRLLQENLVIPVLDGFDEIPDRLRSKALDSLTSSGIARFILTSRPEAFLTASSGRIDLNIVRIDPIHDEDINDQVAGLEAVGGTWVDLGDRVRSDEQIRKALERPLFLGLLRRLALAGAVVPPELLDPNCSTDNAMRALLAEYVERSFKEEWQTSPRPISPRTARRRATLIARTMALHNREDFVWWDLVDLIPWWLQAPLAAVLTWFPFYVIERLLSPELRGLGAMIGVSTLLGLSARGSPARSSRAHPFLVRTGPRRVALAWIPGCLWLTLPSQVPNSVSEFGQFLIQCLFLALMIYLFAIMITAMGRQTVKDPQARFWWSQLGLLTDFSQRQIPRKPGWSWNGQKALAGLGVAAVFNLTPLLSLFEPTTDRAIDRLELLQNALGNFVVTALLILMVLGFGRPLTHWTKNQSRMVLANIMFGLIAPILWFSAIVITVILASRELFLIEGADIRSSTPLPDMPLWQFVAGIVLGAVLVFISLGVFGVTMTLAGRFCLAWLILVIRRRAAVRFFHFLDLAHDQQVLTRNGYAYSFRHPLIRQVLLEVQSGE